MTRPLLTTILFGLLLAVLAILLQFFEYRYLVGSLNTSVYTSVVATIFTGVGIWLGVSLFRKKKQDKQEQVDLTILRKLKLNQREYEILGLIAKGFSNQEIADQLFLALPTIKTHVSNLYSKMGVQSRTQAIHKARSMRLI
ncbi:MAG: hypothetical protein DHS20C17_20290 [Cyclobacteriaceae bacterium]|nr:MAG: hypothetical protein DHS20C17_20290 [Cyclobacteriaceae bacterium]